MLLASNNSRKFETDFKSYQILCRIQTTKCFKIRHKDVLRLGKTSNRLLSQELSGSRQRRERHANNKNITSENVERRATHNFLGSAGGGGGWGVTNRAKLSGRFY